MSTKPVIAIVDDDESIRTALSGLMRSLGYFALAFSGARQFLDSPRRSEVSCLISDIQMPGMSGWELYERLAASEKPIPTILITAYPNDLARDKALKAGVCCYLKKPYTEEEMLTCVRGILDPRGA